MDLKHQKTIFIRLIFAPTELFQFNIMFLKETVILISNDPQCIRKRILHESQRCPLNLRLIKIRQATFTEPAI